MRFVSIAITCLWLAVGGLACAADDPIAGNTTPAPAAATTDDAEKTPVPLPKQALRALAYPPAADRVDPSTVLFLPFVNRSLHRIHPTYLDALDQTLAVHAATQLGLRVVRPELARRLAADLGMSNAPWGIGRRATPQARALDHVARRVGAGVVVWGEIRKDLSLALHASAHAPGADAARWDDFELANPGVDDLALYEAPQRLLAALEEAGRIPPWRTGGSPGEEAEARLMEALAMQGSGHPALLRRAETALAGLAAAHPGWPDPWVRLAFLRALRGTLRNRHGADAGVLGEGANPARHVARRFERLDPEDEARLDAIDHLFLLHLQSPEHLSRLLERAPADALALLAHRHPQRAREPFRLAELEGETVFERAYLAVAAARGDADRVRLAATFREDLDADARLQTPYASRVIAEVARDEGDWMGEYRARLAMTPAHALAVFEILRDRCSALGDAGADCAAPLRDLADLYRSDGGDGDEPAAGLDPDDTRGFDDRMAWVGLHALRADATGRHAASLPDLEVFRDDSTFARMWLLTSRTISAANHVLAAYDQHVGATGTRGDALLTDARDLLRDHLSWLLEAAYQPAWIGYRRVQRDETEPYLEALEPFNDDFPVARYAKLRIRGALGLRANYVQGYGSLARGDLFDERWIVRWLETMKRDGGPEMAVANATLLAAVVPNTHAIARFRAEAWQKAERPEKAIEVLQTASAPMPDPTVALDLEALLEQTGAPYEERLAVLRPAIGTFPFSASLRGRVAHLRLWSGRPDEAEALFRPLLAHPELFEDACFGIGHILGYRGDASAVARHFASCLEQAPDRWAESALYDQLAGLATQRGDYDAAVQALGRADERIGGASYVLGGLGFAHELAGRYEEAEHFYERQREAYSQYPTGHLALASLHMRRGALDAAREVLLASEPDPDDDFDVYVMLGRIHLAEGDLDGFIEQMRKARGASALSAATHILYWTHDYERELALEAEGERAFPDRDFDKARARALVDLGRFEEARPFFEEHLAERPNDNWVRLQLVRSLIGLGKIGRAKALVDEWTEMEPFSRDGVEMRYRLHRAVGDVAKARAELRRAAGWAPPNGSAAYREWWHWQKRWMRLELELGMEDLSPAELERMAALAEQFLHRIPYDLEMWPLLARLRSALGDEPAAAEAHAQAAHWNPGHGESRLARRP